jgi:hypothetical protein
VKGGPTTVLWPPPCVVCGSDIKQQFEWSTDAKNFKQTCHVCGLQQDWRPYPPPGPRVGYTYNQIAAARSKRIAALLDARVRLVLARKLSLHSPPIRDEIGRIITEVDDCLRGLGL